MGQFSPEMHLQCSQLQTIRLPSFGAQSQVNAHRHSLVIQNTFLATQSGQQFSLEMNLQCSQLQVTGLPSFGAQSQAIAYRPFPMSPKRLFQQFSLKMDLQCSQVQKMELPSFGAQSLLSARRHSLVLPVFFRAAFLMLVLPF